MLPQLSSYQGSFSSYWTKFDSGFYTLDFIWISLKQNEPGKEWSYLFTLFIYLFYTKFEDSLLLLEIVSVQEFFEC